RYRSLYSLLLPPGEHTLRYRFPGARTVELPVTVVAGEVLVRDVSLPQSTLGTLAGRVTSANGGTPLAGVTVTVAGSGQPPAATGPDGRYAVEDLPGGVYTVEFTAEAYQSHSVEAVEVVEGQVTTLDAALTPAPAVVVVGDRNGQLTNLLRANGLPAEEAGWEVVDALDAVEVVILNHPPAVDRDTFLAALAAFDAAGVSVIFPAVGFASSTRGVDLLIQHTGDPPAQNWIGTGGPAFFLENL